uniref:Uncharacterized protein n=1 Tax=Seriola dumerili TaxID=41447 RepID=A0A3B4UQF2_SERDU
MVKDLHVCQHTASQDQRVRKLMETEIGTEPLFDSVTRSINTSCQKKEDIMLINATLGVYMSIFSSILQHSHDHTGTSTLLGQVPVSDRSKVKSWVKQLQEETKVLRRELVKVNNNQEDMLRELTKIKVDDPIDQRRALAEFQAVSRAASLLGNVSTATSSHPH